MNSANFAAAQERVLERRRQREAEAEARLAQQRTPPPNLEGLPYPLNRLSNSGAALWDTLRGREGTRPAFRVGQVDAELLDEELLSLFKGQVGDALKYFGPHIRDEWSHEIQLGLRAILFKLAIWDHNASYGAALQGLQFTDGRSKGRLAIPPTKIQKILYGALTVGGRYAWDKWETWLVDQEGGYEEPSHDIRLLSRITSLASTTHSIAAFASFLVFLVNGRYRTLVDRILRMRLAPPSTQNSREVSFEYLNRQLVWHAFTEFLLFLLPLVGIGRWRRWLSRAWRRMTSALRSNGEDDDQQAKQGELAFLPERTCAICYQDQNPTSTSEGEVIAVSSAAGGIIGSAQTDITNPYETVPCGCLYCFVCVAQKIESEEGQGWTCLRCGETVKQCAPWGGDVLQEEAPRSRTTPAKSVVFAEMEDTEVQTVTAATSVTEEEEDEEEDEEDEEEEEDETYSEISEKEEVGFSPFQDMDSDGTMQESSQWSAVEKESTDDTSVGSDTETGK